MHLPVPNVSDREFELPPAGTHLAICYRIADLGTQDVTYQGETKRKHQVLISWELPQEKMADGRPFSVNKKYTWSMHDKATLRHHLESWRGQPFRKEDFGPGGFDICKILGVGCLLNIAHTPPLDGKIFANITSVTKLMKGMAVPDLTNEKSYFWLKGDRWDSSEFNKLGRYWQGVIMKSPEYQDLMGSGEPDYGGPMPDDHHHELNDQIPF